MSCYFDSYFLSGKQTGVLGRQPRRGPWNRASGNLPQPWNRGDKSLIFGDFFFLNFFFLLFWGGNGNFPCRRSLLPKNCCSPGVVERKRCPSARFWSGSAPADRDVWLSRPGVPQAGTEGKVRASPPGQLLGNKWILQGPKCYSCPVINTGRACGDLHRAHVKVLWQGKQKQVTNADAPGFHEVAARKKEEGPMNYLCPPPEFNPRIFSAYINISSLFTPSFQKHSPADLKPISVHTFRERGVNL